MCVIIMCEMVIETRQWLNRVSWYRAKSNLQDFHWHHVYTRGQWCSYLAEKSQPGSTSTDPDSITNVTQKTHQYATKIKAKHNQCCLHWVNMKIMDGCHTEMTAKKKNPSLCLIISRYIYIIYNFTETSLPHLCCLERHPAGSVWAAGQ